MFWTRRIIWDGVKIGTSSTMPSRKIPASHAAAAHSAAGQQSRSGNGQQEETGSRAGVRWRRDGDDRSRAGRKRGPTGPDTSRGRKANDTTRSAPPHLPRRGSNGTRSLRPSKANRHTGRTGIKPSASAPSHSIKVQRLQAPSNYFLPSPFRTL